MVGKVGHTIGSPDGIWSVGGAGQAAGDPRRLQLRLSAPDPAPLLGIRPGRRWRVRELHRDWRRCGDLLRPRGRRPLGPVKDLITGTSEEPGQEPAPPGSEGSEAAAGQPT